VTRILSALKVFGETVAEDFLLDLRNALDDATLNVRRSCQIARIEALRLSPGHSIELVSTTPDDLLDHDAFDCHAYSLALVPPYPSADRPSPAFIEWLVEQERSLPVPVQDRADGDLLVYWEGSEIRHSGIWTGNRVRSKWGSGHVWRHKTWETPAPYGLRACSFRAHVDIGWAWSKYLAEGAGC
jgi:hypothetical protein